MAFIRLSQDIIINTDQITVIDHGGPVFGNYVTMSSGEKYKFNAQDIRIILEAIGM